MINKKFYLIPSNNLLGVNSKFFITVPSLVKRLLGIEDKIILYFYGN